MTGRSLLPPLMLLLLPVSGCECSSLCFTVCSRDFYIDSRFLLSHQRASLSTFRLTVSLSLSLFPSVALFSAQLQSAMSLSLLPSCDTSCGRRSECRARELESGDRFLSANSAQVLAAVASAVLSRLTHSPDSLRATSLVVVTGCRHTDAHKHRACVRIFCVSHDERVYDCGSSHMRAVSVKRKDKIGDSQGEDDTCCPTCSLTVLSPDMTSSATHSPQPTFCSLSVARFDYRVIRAIDVRCCIECQEATADAAAELVLTGTDC